MDGDEAGRDPEIAASRAAIRVATARCTLRRRRTVTTTDNNVTASSEASPAPVGASSPSGMAPAVAWVADRGSGGSLAGARLATPIGPVRQAAAGRALTPGACGSRGRPERDVGHGSWLDRKAPIGCGRVRATDDPDDRDPSALLDCRRRNTRPSQADHGHSVPADADLGLPAATETMHVHHCSGDPDEPPFMR